ncbi:hypothetical protein [Metapseudomonas otitidis]|uniref:hypothetical protein n=1 Tax=Metapseudomonas otitidis TaxID=319939 RepID=UPI0013F69581|nr:hypothetical protein [Pseudomonas otitidis]
MNNDKSISRVAEIIKAKYHPEQYKAEQEQKQRELNETLAFVDGVLAAYNAQKEKESKEAEIAKSQILFVTDPLHPRGWTKNK